MLYKKYVTYMLLLCIGKVHLGVLNNKANVFANFFADYRF